MKDRPIEFPQLPDFHLGWLIDIRDYNHRLLTTNRKIDFSRLIENLIIRK